MNWGTLNDVPAPIREFYVEREDRIITGYVISEDDEGVAIRTPVFDVVMIVEPTVTRTNCQWSLVKAAADERKPLATVERLIEAAVEHDKYNFHEEYLNWLRLCAAIDAQADSLERARNEDGHNRPDEPDILQADEAWEGSLLPEQIRASKPAPPVRSVRDGKEYLVALAKQERDDGEYRPITVDELTFDSDSKSYEKMKGAVESWEILMDDPELKAIGLVQDGQMYWTLADNTDVLIGKGTLQKVLAAIRVRAGILHAAYKHKKNN